MPSLYIQQSHTNKINFSAISRHVPGRDFLYVVFFVLSIYVRLLRKARGRTGVQNSRHFYHLAKYQLASRPKNSQRYLIIDRKREAYVRMYSTYNSLEDNFHLQRVLPRPSSNYLNAASVLYLTKKPTRSNFSRQLSIENIYRIYFQNSYTYEWYICTYMYIRLITREFIILPQPLLPPLTLRLLTSIGKSSDRVIIFVTRIHPRLVNQRSIDMVHLKVEMGYNSYIASKK